MGQNLDLAISYGLTFYHVVKKGPEKVLQSLLKIQFRFESVFT